MAKAKLKQAGIVLNAHQETIQQLAARHNLSPRQIYKIMAAGATEKSAGKIFPENPPAGFGRQTLAQTAQTYQLDLKKLTDVLSEQGISAQPTLSIREIAEANSRSAMDVFEIIKQSAK